MKWGKCCFLVVLLTPWRGLANDFFPVTLERNVPIKMRDGMTLRADIYRPKAEGRFPVLLQRTPYDKNSDVETGIEGATRGYVVIIQDVRGRYSSEGEWYPFKHESDDGYDTIEWAATMPYSDGRVGMFGSSYVGATQMLAAITHPPHLAGICPIVTASNYHENWTYHGGAFEQWFSESWTTGLAQDTVSHAVSDQANVVNGMWQLPLSMYRLFNFPAATGVPTSLQDIAPYFLDWLAHPDYDSYWSRWSIEDHYGDINVPALHVAAWYDIFQDGSLRNYMGIKANGGEAARKSQHLLVSVGGHSGDGHQVGDVDFGPNAPFSESETTLRWYDYLLKGVRNEFAGESVKIFVMGTNQWREETDWPLARARSTKYFLHSQGKANSLRGDGTLSTSAPGAETPDKYVYEPSQPVPTTGGPLCCDERHERPGPLDQRPVEARDDVLIYSTASFTRDTEVTGPVLLEFYAKSSSIDTDFTAKLVDVWPNGFTQNLTEGIIRARYRESTAKAVFLNPDQIYKFNLNLWSTSNVFLKGHMLRLEVSSSNFPRFDRNLNTGQPAAAGHVYVSATNTILHDAEHPSALILPVVQ